MDNVCFECAGSGRDTCDDKIDCARCGGSGREYLHGERVSKHALYLMGLAELMRAHRSGLDDGPDDDPTEHASDQDMPARRAVRPAS